MNNDDDYDNSTNSNHNNSSTSSLPGAVDRECALCIYSSARASLDLDRLLLLLLALAFFMLALIGLKKFRSFQKPSRARELRAGNAAAIPRQSRSPGDGSGAGVGAQWQKKAVSNVGSERNFGEQLATICRGFLFFPCVFSYFFATRSAESLVPMRIFFGSWGMKDP